MVSLTLVWWLISLCAEAAAVASRPCQTVVPPPMPTLLRLPVPLLGHLIPEQASELLPWQPPFASWRTLPVMHKHSSAGTLVRAHSLLLLIL